MAFKFTSPLYRYLIAPLACMRLVQVYAVRVQYDCTTYGTAVPFWRR